MKTWLIAITAEDGDRLEFSVKADKISDNVSIHALVKSATFARRGECKAGDEENDRDEMLHCNLINEYFIVNRKISHTVNVFRIYALSTNKNV